MLKENMSKILMVAASGWREGVIFFPASLNMSVISVLFLFFFYLKY